MKKEKLSTKICPKCGNVDFPPGSNFPNLIAPAPEKCGKCGYTGLFPEIDIDEIKEFRKGLKKK